MLETSVKNDIENKKHLTRHFDLIDFDKLNTPITVIGAGGIGSWTVFALAKMGFSNITVYDHDVVSIENVGNQLYGFAHVDELKVTALMSICDSVGANLRVFSRKFSPSDCIGLNGIVILALDSMEARVMVDSALLYNCFLIDGRMGAEKILLYTAQGIKQRENYAKSLYSDENAEQVPCTAKATSYCALTISGLIVGQVKSYIQGHRTIKNMSMDAASGASIRFGH